MVAALTVLVEDGLAKAYDLFGALDPFAGEIQGMPSLSEAEEYFRTYFHEEGHGSPRVRQHVVAPR